MKPLQYVRLLLVSAAAALLSACGGDDVNGDLFVSVQQFESGGAGFWLQGTGGDLRIVSIGVGNNGDIINVKGVGTEMQGPYAITSSSDENAEKIIPPGWEDLGKVGDQSRIVQGNLIAGGRTLAGISSMVYSIESGNHRGHLSMVFNVSENTTSFNAALAAFFGCTNTVQTNNRGNNNGNYNNYWQYNNGRRVIFPDAGGVSIQMWFDFSSGRALAQMVGAVSNDTETDENNNNYHRYQEGPTAEGAIFSAQNAIFRKIIR